ncbi:MAG TPA: DUF4845 domain-containing protein [Rhodanobacteraceae bacterium]|nr:DUF4845 domain-containing protein [Rhodanobacteraceae bacterium]
MNMQRHHRGLTLIGFLVVLCVVGFFAYMAMRLMPVYFEYFGVVKAMEQLREEGTWGSRSIEEIRRELDVKFDTQYVDTSDVPPQAIQLKREGGAATLRIAYEKRVPFVYNVDLVASFDKSVNLSGSGGD